MNNTVTQFSAFDSRQRAHSHFKRRIESNSSYESNKEHFDTEIDNIRMNQLEKKNSDYDLVTANL